MHKMEYTASRPENRLPRPMFSPFPPHFQWLLATSRVQREGYSHLLPSLGICPEARVSVLQRQAVLPYRRQHQGPTALQLLRHVLQGQAIELQAAQYEVSVLLTQKARKRIGP